MHEILILQHIACEGPARIADVLREEGAHIRIVRTDRGEAIPSEVRTARGIVIMGGPMGVYEHERYPHLDQERRLVENALHAEVPLLGVCLGSQILADALGARVAPSGKQEIGWFEVTLREPAREDAVLAGTPQRFEALHWHGDVFDLPRGAVSLASSAQTEHQAFRYGKNAYGLLFHLEADLPQVRAMADAFRSELVAARIDGDAIASRATTAIETLAPIGRTVFRNWAHLTH